MIRSSLEYDLPLLKNTDSIQALEKVQMESLKLLAGMPKSKSKAAIYRLFALPPMSCAVLASARYVRRRGL
jgi:hypothetical protein